MTALLLLVTATHPGYTCDQTAAADTLTGDRADEKLPQQVPPGAQVHRGGGGALPHACD